MTNSKHQTHCHRNKHKPLQTSTETVYVSTFQQKLKLLLFFWHAPPGVQGVRCRHQSPEWTILSHVDCFIQGEIIGRQVLLDSLHPHSTRASRWSSPVLQGQAVKIFLASVSSGIRVMWPNGEKRSAWTIAKSGTIWFLNSLNYFGYCKIWLIDWQYKV